MPKSGKPRLGFEPDVSIGDLLVLAKLSNLHNQQGFANPGKEFRKETGVSADRVRDAMIRIDKGVGRVEKVGNGRRSQQPTATGGNIGTAGVLANLVIHIARNETRIRRSSAMSLKCFFKCCDRSIRGEN